MILPGQLIRCPVAFLILSKVIPEVRIRAKLFYRMVNVLILSKKRFFPMAVPVYATDIAGRLVIIET